jgi:fucose permease
MSHLVARILLSIFVIPLAAIVYGVSIIASFEILDLRSGAKVFLTAGMATWVFVAGYWFLLWRSTVRWTSARVSASAIAVFVSFVGGSLVGLAMSPVDDEVGYFMASITVPLLWMVLTTLAWRETPAERAARQTPTSVACPTCGYNLTGLSETRCPECGTRFTIDQLLAAQLQPTGSELQS